MRVRSNEVLIDDEDQLDVTIEHGRNRAQKRPLLEDVVVQLQLDKTRRFSTLPAGKHYRIAP